VVFRIGGQTDSRGPALTVINTTAVLGLLKKLTNTKQLKIHATNFFILVQQAARANLRHRFKFIKKLL